MLKNIVVIMYTFTCQENCNNWELKWQSDSNNHNSWFIYICACVKILNRVVNLMIYLVLIVVYWKVEFLSWWTWNSVLTNSRTNVSGDWNLCNNCNLAIME